jgi:uncharacterized coiled-coil DUF342 family protein
MASISQMQTQKDGLVNKIDFLKREVQYLIDKKKAKIVSKFQDHEQIASIEDDKNEKIKEIKQLTEDLKKIVVRERKEKQRLKDMAAISRAIDNIEFGGAKKKRTQEAMTKAKSAKEIRDRAREDYNKYLEYDQKYKLLDPLRYQGCYFCTIRY